MIHVHLLVRIYSKYCHLCTATKHPLRAIHTQWSAAVQRCTYMCTVWTLSYTVTQKKLCKFLFVRISSNFHQFW